MSKRVRLLLVDDHAFFRRGLREMLGEFDEVEYRVGPRTLSVLS